MQSNEDFESSLESNALLEKLRVAREAVTLAEAELDKAVAQIAAAPRAMKTTISVGLRSVFTSLHGAKTTLALLEQATRERSSARAPLDWSLDLA